MKWIRFALIVLVGAALAGPTTESQAQSGARPQVPGHAPTRAPTAAERIRHAAALYRFDRAMLDRAAQNGLAAPIVAARLRVIRDAAEAMLTSVLIDAAARDPDRIESYVFQAIRAAPEIAPGVVRRLTHAMPRDAVVIRQTLRAAQALPAAGEEESIGD